MPGPGTVRAGLALLGVLQAAAVGAQEGTLTGRVSEAESGRALGGITVHALGTRASVLTSGSGRYVLPPLAPGAYRLRFSWLGYEPVEREVTLPADTVVLDVSLTARPIPIGEIRVTGVSRQPERVIEAPAAVVVPPRPRVEEMAVTGQAPLVLADLTGVHVAQSGIYDFNVNVRGFNGSISRNLLVLVDGRDVSVPIIGNQEWSAIQLVEEAGRIELIRGPGSALYGANAFNGVLNILTPDVRQDRGTRFILGGGELSTFRLDARHAWLSDDLRWGYRVAGGYSESGTFDRARTQAGYLEREYGDALDPSFEFTPPPAPFELLPLRGQSLPGGRGTAPVGEPDPVWTYYGQGRVDFYGEDGSVVTGEAGFTQTQNAVLVTGGGGRSQITDSKRPWARFSWTDDDFGVNAYFTGRDGESVSLATGQTAFDAGGTFQVEGQLNGAFAGGRGRHYVGASFRNTTIDSDGTVLASEHDGRSDQYYGLFGQVEYEVLPDLEAVFAARVDEGTLHSTQFSPKLGLVFTPAEGQQLRLTYNRAYLTPRAFEYFLEVPIAAPVDLTELEAAIRAFIDPLEGIPTGTLFSPDGSVPVLGIGNDDLDPQQVTGLELGYKGQLGRVFVGADVYYSELEDFTTGFRAGVNPDFPPWTAPESLPAATRAALEAFVFENLGPGFTRLDEGVGAFVVSATNAGRAEEWGFELGSRVDVREGLRIDANYAFYDFSLDEPSFLTGDLANGNTPRHRANVAVTWDDGGPLRARVGLRLRDRFTWGQGLFVGEVPASQSVDLNLSYRVNAQLTLGVVGTNVLDQEHYHVFGGSIVGRRILTSLTWRP